jgi:uncharacterized protein YndB with AHSA1/START domain
MTAFTPDRSSQHTRIDPDAHEFVMERTFAAPRERVFRAFASCEAISQWWGPAGWTLPVCEMDFRVGGTWFYGMRSPDGDQMAYGKTVYETIEEPTRIVWRDYFTDGVGAILPDMPELHTTIEFIDVDGRTRLRNIARFHTAQDLQTVISMGMESGMAESFDRLEEQVTTDRP